METLKVAIIGTGIEHGKPGASGFGMAHAHMQGYQHAQGTRLVAVADIIEERGKAFVEKHEPTANVYTDYRKMLAKEKPDVVSICTWPALHCEMVIAAAEAGVRAIHCEKPMAVTFGDARRMNQACVDRKVQLSFNHQRRFNAIFRKAKEVLKSGAIGDLQRLEAKCSNLYDWGTHWFDMMFFFNDDTPVEWLIGQVETRGDSTIFGVHMEGQGVAHFKYKNEVRGLMVTGHQADWGAQIRIVGSAGQVEIEPKGPKGTPPLRMWGAGQGGWEEVKTTDSMHANDGHTYAVMDVIESLRGGREPELSGRKALQATELIFATYESSRRRGRIDFPLDIEDSPYLDMLNAKR